MDLQEFDIHIARLVEIGRVAYNVVTRPHFKVLVSGVFVPEFSVFEGLHLSGCFNHVGILVIKATAMRSDIGTVVEIVVLLVVVPVRADVRFRSFADV